ncbi:MAG: ParB/RepB/Spo0J family partition protein [Sulfobacillus sp.]
MKQRAGLGRGLEALLPQMGVSEGEEVSEILLETIRPNPYQPRKRMDEEKLAELMNSIKEHGVLQPIMLRVAVPRGYEIVAGERRFRAVERLGMARIPAIVRTISDKQAMEIALIENLQREDLNAIEIAEAYLNVMKHFDLTQEELAARVGQSRSHVANMLRLLALPDELRADVSRGTISMGHARALLSVNDEGARMLLARKIVAEGLSVRAVEVMCQHLADVPRGTKKQERRQPDPQIRAVEERLRNRLGTSVRIQMGKKRGKIEIDYFSLDDLDRILALFAVAADDSG